MTSVIIVNNENSCQWRTTGYRIKMSKHNQDNVTLHASSQKQSKGSQKPRRSYVKDQVCVCIYAQAAKSTFTPMTRGINWSKVHSNCLVTCADRNTNTCQVERTHPTKQHQHAVQRVTILQEMQTVPLFQTWQNKIFDLTLTSICSQYIYTLHLQRIIKMIINRT